MKHRDFHLLEKIQVQLATVGTLCIVYFGLWPALRPGGPQDPASFLATGGIMTLLAFAVALWALAGLCALVTIHARPEGALVAALFGAAGISLHSPKIRALLWARENDLPAMYGQLIAEVLILAAVVLGAVVAVSLVRAVIGLYKPGWLWTGPLAKLRKDEPPQQGRSAGAVLMAALRHGPLGLFLRKGLGELAGDPRRKPTLRQTAGFLGLGLVIAVVVLLLLMRSPQRGQILFALVVSFALGVTLAHQAFPSPYSILALAMPVAAAVGFYILASVATSVTEMPLIWTDVPYYGRALPVDWVTAGGGGALLGFWISSRLHEIKYVSQQEQEKER